MGGCRSLDAVKSFVFSGLPLKAEDQPAEFDCWSSAVEAWLSGDATSPGDGLQDSQNAVKASAYLHALTVARGRLLELLQLTGSSPADVAAAQSRYLELLVEADAVEQQSVPFLKSTWIDSLLPLAAFTPEASSSCGSITTGSKWFGASAQRKQAAESAAAAAAAAVQEASQAVPCGYVYEAANMLLAIATWKMGRAASLIMAPTGAAPGSAMEAYQQFCQAAGVLDELRRTVLPRLGRSTSGDLQRELLTALYFFALAEAQTIMLQRGVALNYQGSSLAPMATDTAMLYSQAYEALEATAKALKLPWNPLPPLDKADSSSNSSSNGSTATDDSSGPAKNSRMAGFERILAAQLPTCWPVEAEPLLQLAGYLLYQLGHCYCMAAICGAEVSLSSNKAGQAVALAQMGTNLCSTLQELGFELRSCLDPVISTGKRDSSRRLALQTSLEHKAAFVLRKCMRENRTIYFQYVPEQPSALPWPQRSAQPEGFKLPASKGRLTRATAKSGVTATAAGSSMAGFTTHDRQQGAPATAAVRAEPLLSAAALQPLLSLEHRRLGLLAFETEAVAALAMGAAALASKQVPQGLPDDTPYLTSSLSLPVAGTSTSTRSSSSSRSRSSSSACGTADTTQQVPALVQRSTPQPLTAAALQPWVQPDATPDALPAAGELSLVQATDGSLATAAVSDKLHAEAAAGGVNDDDVIPAQQLPSLTLQPGKALGSMACAAVDSCSEGGSSRSSRHSSSSCNSWWAASDVSSSAGSRLGLRHLLRSFLCGCVRPECEDLEEDEAEEEYEESSEGSDDSWESVSDASFILCKQQQVPAGRQCAV